MYLKLGFIFIISLCFQQGVLWLFRSLKLYQPIYGLSPKTHQLKSQTPSLGGIGILGALWVSWLFYGFFDGSSTVLWLMIVFTLFSILGMIDDCLSLFKKNNKGLSVKQKFLCQIFLAIVLMVVYTIFIAPLSFIQLLFYSFIIVSSSNATNLTDGLDGLLATCSLVTLLGFYIVGNQELQLFSLFFGLIVMGFLWFNRHPAKLFMGDTGSLGVGALFAGMAIALGDVWVLIPLGLVYILETLSVMIQVFYFKRTQKRIFLMAPLHHHFELLGISETRVVQLFVVFALVGLIILIGI